MANAESIQDQAQLSNQYPGLNLLPAQTEISQKRVEMTVFGFWVFLMSDLITFGIFFATYAVSANAFGMAGGPTPRDLFDINSVLLQTVLLLVSSFTAGMTGVALKYRSGTGRVLMWLIITFLLGAAFLYFELRDFSNFWALGGTPMRSGWLSSLYALVGLHGVHIMFGLLWIAVMIAMLAVRGSSELFASRLLIFTLYWHFLDLIWIAIFSFVFLWGLS